MDASSRPNNLLWILIASLDATKSPLATVNPMKRPKSAGPRFCDGSEMSGGADAMIQIIDENHSVVECEYSYMY